MKTKILLLKIFLSHLHIKLNLTIWWQISDASTIVTTDVIYYDAGGNEVKFSSTTTTGSSIFPGPGFGDYNYTQDVPYACEYFVRTTLKASTCQPCCGESHMVTLGMNGEGCNLSSGVSPHPDAGKPVLIYESKLWMVGPTDLIELGLKEFKCSCDCP